MRSKPLLLALAAGALAGCGTGPAVPPVTKNAYDLDSPQGRAVMNHAPVPGAPGSAVASTPRPGG